MNILKKITIGLVALFAIMAPISTVLADSYGLDKAANQAGLQKDIQGKSDPLEIVGLVIKAGLSLVGLVFFGLMLYAGITWMIARGDSGKVDKAKDTMESAIIGLVIIVSAYAIVNFVFQNVITGTTPNAITSITPASIKALAEKNCEPCGSCINESDNSKDGGYCSSQLVDFKTSDCQHCCVDISDISVISKCL